MKSKLFLVQANEVSGEHERLISFLLTARDLKAAERKAIANLKFEWGKADRPQRGDKEAGIVATFFGGEIMVKSMCVNPITPEDALKRFTRGG